ncbi:MAG: hypothetical protein M1426_06275, partial [Patescibacteria group bacterium]|nr:hypothetical protein [Patescibacteria group bacterium]
EDQIEARNEETARLDFSSCPSCNGHIVTTDQYCPRCAFPLDGHCPECGENLRLSDRRKGINSEWWRLKYCPYCRVKICEDS